jgi:peptidoglycan/xylan/chitin deacetylase (PgdA/CDA1 family)
VIREDAPRSTDAVDSHLPNSALAAALGPFLPTYHLVTDGEEVAHTRHLYRHRFARQFEADLDVLLQAFSPISLDTLVAHLDGEVPLPRRSMFLSFDDGLRQQVEIVAPLLRRKGVPATFFIVRDFVDNASLFYRFKASLLIDALTGVDEIRLAQIGSRLQLPRPDHERCVGAILRVGHANRIVLDELAAMLELDFDDYLAKRRPFMTVDEISSLVAAGFTVGAHSLDHPRYAELPLAEQLRQTRASVDFVRSTFAAGPAAFAFPFSDEGVGQEFFASAFSTGGLAVSFTSGSRSRQQWPRNLRRTMMDEREGSARQVLRRLASQRSEARPHGD